MSRRSYVDNTARLTCPNCGGVREEEMPTDACQFFYECTYCESVMRPKPGDCCVFCSYADRRCPPKQMEQPTTSGAGDRSQHTIEEVGAASGVAQD